MNTTIRNVLGVAITIGILAVGASAWSYVRSYGDAIQPSSFRSFSVTGEGRVVAVPDVARFTFSVVTEGGTDVARVQEENTAKVNRGIEFVKSLQVEAKDIKTLSYQIEPRYQYYSCPREGAVSPCPPPEIVGYTVTQSVQVTVRDFAKIGNLLGGVVKEGANSVSSLSFTVDDPTALESRARAEAIGKAQEQARTVSRAAGFSLGRLLGIDEGGVRPIPYYAEAYGKGGGDSMPVPTIEPGSQEVTVEVTLRYEIR